MSQQLDHDIHTRVGVLEGAVAGVKADVANLRGEIKGDMAAVRDDIRQLVLSIQKSAEKAAERGSGTNWFQMGSAIALTITIVSAVFGLAEWRIRDALAPIDKHIERLDHTVKAQTEIIAELNRAREDQRVRLTEMNSKFDRFDRAISWYPKLEIADGAAPKR
jgi:uncharacterized coiled-coil protein SlyX